MAMKLSGKQSWLTRSGRVLEEAIEKHASIGKEPSGHQAAELQRIREARHDIKFKADQLDKALDNFLNAADEMEAINDDWRTRSEQNINAAQEFSIRAQERLAELSWEIERRSNSGQSKRNQDGPSLPNLAPLPIPKFRGQLWEWDHF
ncbi:unnamed protein product, partial [Nippostrongylus brasiliensis]|uniref:Syntaxin-6_N domain-containing protein n=1 Tax=Nippostrongylus brasiliensis TaxID=27835 RepID=A0A0N4YUT5_NIPBR